MTPPVDIERLKAVYAEMKSTGRVAERFGLSKSTVGRLLNAAGVALPRAHRGGPTPTTTAEQDQEIVRLYVAGATTVSLAARFSTGRDRIAKLIRQAGHKLRNRGANPDRQYRPRSARLDEIRCLAAQGLPAKAIAERLGATPDAVRKMAKQYGITIRKLSQSELAAAVKRRATGADDQHLGFDIDPTAGAIILPVERVAAVLTERPRTSLDAQIDALRRQGRTGRDIVQALRLPLQDAVDRGLIPPVAVTDRYGNDPRSKRRAA